MQRCSPYSIPTVILENTSGRRGPWKWDLHHAHGHVLVQEDALWTKERAFHVTNFLEYHPKRRSMETLPSVLGLHHKIIQIGRRERYNADEVLSFLGAAGISLKLSKCYLFKDRTVYLGDVVLNGKLADSVKYRESVLRSPFPTDKTKLKSFLWMWNEYRRFLFQYSKVARPLNEILRKDREPDWYRQSEIQTKSFEDLNAAFDKTPILPLTKRGRRYMIYTDASHYYIGETILQHKDKENPDTWYMIVFWSSKLTDTEQRYYTTERECL